MSERIQGTVKYMHGEEYGFIKPDDSKQRDMFVHCVAISASGLSGLSVGDRVSYEVGIHKQSNRPIAINLKLH